MFFFAIKWSLSLKQLSPISMQEHEHVTILFLLGNVNLFHKKADTCSIIHACIIKTYWLPERGKSQNLRFSLLFLVFNYGLHNLSIWMILKTQFFMMGHLAQKASDLPLHIDIRIKNILRGITAWHCVWFTCNVFSDLPTDQPHWVHPLEELYPQRCKAW